LSALFPGAEHGTGYRTQYRAHDRRTDGAAHDCSGNRASQGTPRRVFDAWTIFFVGVIVHV
jgi:hypothetical protein